MKIAIMQPYFFPYIGYFQLINAVDEFVIYDDVNFIKGGWINRNRILLKDAVIFVNIPLEGASSFKRINEINIGRNKEKMLVTIQHAYKKAPYYNIVFPLIAEIIKYNNDNLATFLKNSIIKISEYLQIGTKIISSSDIKKNLELKSQEKVISICSTLDATQYYNAIGGQDLYSKEKFSKNGLTLNFIKTRPIIYSQCNNPFVPWLSIIDVMMFNSQDVIHEMLLSYDLL